MCWARARNSSLVLVGSRSVTRVTGVAMSSSNGTIRGVPSSSPSGKGAVTLKPTPSSSTATVADGSAPAAPAAPAPGRRSRPRGSRSPRRGPGPGARSRRRWRTPRTPWSGPAGRAPAGCRRWRPVAMVFAGRRPQRPGRPRERRRLTLVVDGRAVDVEGDEVGVVTAGHATGHAPPARISPSSATG